MLLPVSAVDRANRYTDDRDVIEGGLGNDRIFVNDGDTANAGQGVRQGDRQVGQSRECASGSTVIT